MEFFYSVWFRNSTFTPDDQDFEWPACFIIEARSQVDALEWGDHLSRNYVADNSDEKFLRSDVEEISQWSDNLNELPRIKYGYEASNNEIGW